MEKSLKKLVIVSFEARACTKGESRDHDTREYNDATVDYFWLVIGWFHCAHSIQKQARANAIQI